MPKVRGIRYADDLVFILKPDDDALKLRQKVDEFLSQRGLNVKEAKTRIVKATDGFDFLGWRFEVKSNGKFICRPAQKNYQKLKDRVKKVMKMPIPIMTRIQKCGSAVRGWRNYHKYCDMGHHSLWHLGNWVWKKINQCKSISRWKASELIHDAMPSVKWEVNAFVAVKGDASPYDGNLIYWSKRACKLYEGATSKALMKQKHLCGECNLAFMPGDKIELHHVDGNHDNWKPKNLIALHRECHQHLPRA